GGGEEMRLRVAVRISVEGKVEVGSRTEGKRRADDTDDGVGLASELDGFADDGWIGAEPAVPEAIRNDHDISAARAVFFGCKGAALRDWRAEEAEEFIGDVDAFDLLRTIPAADIHAGAAAVVGGDVVEHLRLLAPHVLLRNRSSGEISLRARIEELDDAVRFGVGKWLQEHRVYNGEDRGVRADAEGEDSDSGHRESGAPAEEAGGV